MAPTYSQTLTTFVSSTLDDHRKTIIDNIWTATEILAWASSLRRPQQGGKKIFIPLEYGKNTSIKKGLGRGSKLELVQDEIITECWYDWHTYGGSVIRYRDDDLENSGKYAIFNMVEAYINNMIKSFQETIEQDLVATANPSGEGFYGLGYLVEDVNCAATATTQTAGSNTIGNLSRASYPWFTNWGRTMTTLDPATYLEYYMREQNDNVRAYTGKDAQVIITHPTCRNYYEDNVGRTLRTMSAQLGDIGIKAVEYKGIPFLTSLYANDSKMYFIGADTLEMIYEPRMWFKSTDWKEPTQMPFDYARQTLAKGQFIIKKPRGCSVLYAIGA